MNGLLITIFSLMGMAVASFLNVIIDRLPENKSIVGPPSHCPECGHKLTPLDLIPVFSFLLLRGRCRYCASVIPKRVLFVEFSGAVIFGYLFWHFGLQPSLFILIFYCCTLLLLLVIDIERNILPNKITYPVIIISLGVSFFISPLAIIDPAGKIPLWLVATAPQSGVLNALLGGGCGLATFLLIFLVSRGGIGFGDVKMALLIGLMCGFPMVIPAILISFISGGVAAVILIATKRKGRRDTMPFGAFLAPSTLIILIWGAPILNWYLNLYQSYY